MPERRCLCCHRSRPLDAYSPRRRICQDCYEDGRVTPFIRRVVAAMCKAEWNRRSRAAIKLARRERVDTRPLLLLMARL